MRKTTVRKYIALMEQSQDEYVKKIGAMFKKYYLKTVTHSQVSDLLSFLDLIDKHANAIGEVLTKHPQARGRFRAYLLEEFVYKLAKDTIRNVSNADIYWDKEYPVYEYEEHPAKYYKISSDISIEINGVPKAFIEVKVDVDAQRLKASLFTMLLLKSKYNSARFALVYVNRQVDKNLLKLAKKVILDEIFEFKNQSEVERFKKWLLSNLS